MIINLHYFIYIRSKQKMKDAERIQVFYIVWYVHRPFAPVWMVTHFHLFMYLLLFVSIVTTITSSHLSLQFPLQQLQQHHRTQWSTRWATMVTERDEKMGCWYVNKYLYSYFFSNWDSEWWWRTTRQIGATVMTNKSEHELRVYNNITDNGSHNEESRTQHQRLTMTTWARYIVFCILLLASF